MSPRPQFVICYNPEAADRDATARQRLIAQLTDLIDDTDRLPATKRAELRAVITTKPGLNRFLRVTPGGLLRVDAAAITADAKLDGKYLLRTSDPQLSTQDIALGYKQLLEVERGWRDMKHVLDLRPIYHRLEDRIRAHVLLCWLALLLARIVETQAGSPDQAKVKAEQRLDGNTCCAAPTRPCRPRTSPWATNSYSKSNAAGAT